MNPRGTHPRFSILTEFVLAALWCGRILCATEPESAEPTADIPFYSQLNWSNDTSIHRSVRRFVENLDDLSGQVLSQVGAPDAAASLKVQLDAGERIEPAIGGEVEAIIQFQEQRNRMLDTWAGQEPPRREYFGRLKVTAKQVREVREAFGDWPYLPPLWVLSAIRTGRDNHEIPEVGLKLSYETWLGSASHDLKKYTWFFFLRKACHPAEYDQAFVERETGGGPAWNVPTQSAVFSRSTYEIYRYNYIPRDVQQPPAKEKTLVDAMRAECLWDRRTALKTHYARKLVLFRQLAAEMESPDSLAVGARPYLDFYGYLGRSFPWLSVFRFTPTDDVSGRFVDGYAGDRPGGTGKGLVFATDSPFGVAYRLLDKLDGRVDPQSLLGPLLLLQVRLAPPDAEGDSADGRYLCPDFHYEDVRVGFKGYLDLYQKTIGTTDAPLVDDKTSGGKP